MLHHIAVAGGQRKVFTAQFSRHGLIPGGEIANVRFMNRHFRQIGFGFLGMRHRQTIPAFWLKIAVVEVNDLTVFRVSG